MEFKFIRRETIDGRIVLLFSGTTVETLSEKAHDFFTACNYKLKTGLAGNGAYAYGNYVLRLLFGAFVRYFKFNVDVTRRDENTLALRVEKGHSGFSGGVTGIMKLNKE